MYDLCIFDLDGTLADTVDSMAHSANLALGEMGMESQPADAFRYFAGDGVYELAGRCLRAAGDTEAQRFDEFLVRYRNHFASHCMYHVKPYEGICDLLEELKKSGIKIAVLSNKPHQQAVDVIEELFGAGYFDFVQGQQDGIPRKPDPAGALHIAEMADVRPEHCLYLGDTDTDMQTGHAAGMHTVGVLWGFRTREELEENHAGYLASHPLDIIPIAKEGQR